ncbi:hypothetical protein [Azospirillum brasilense]|uniref:hypothetical protein n=1 Tax=Azospirillum brasilense TaxID=192 RepID=UPI00117780D6|nr:hypothetical protein [Azospirillum brasilense]
MTQQFDLLIGNPPFNNMKETTSGEIIDVPVPAKKINVVDDTAQQNEKQTAKRGIDILVGKNKGYVVPNQAQRIKLSVAFAQRGQVLYGRAFDLVKIPKGADIDTIIEDSRSFREVIVCEVKSTKQRSIGPDFRGYFFDLTTAELLVAQSLKDQFSFVFVHTVTGKYIEVTLRDLYARSRAIYPKWAVQF